MSGRARGGIWGCGFCVGFVVSERLLLARVVGRLDEIWSGRCDGCGGGDLVREPCHVDIYIAACALAAVSRGTVDTLERSVEECSRGTKELSIYCLHSPHTPTLRARLATVPCFATLNDCSEMSLMAPLAKPMVPQSHSSVMSLARSSSLEGSTISDHLRSEGPGADTWTGGGGNRRDGGGAGQVRLELLYNSPMLAVLNDSCVLEPRGHCEAQYSCTVFHSPPRMKNTTLEVQLYSFWKFLPDWRRIPPPPPYSRFADLLSVFPFHPVSQARPRHERKRSEGSGFDVASRWTDISREEKGKWLIQEYGKVRVCVSVFSGPCSLYGGSFATPDVAGCPCNVFFLAVDVFFRLLSLTACFPRSVHRFLFRLYYGLCSVLR